MDMNKTFYPRVNRKVAKGFAIIAVLALVYLGVFYAAGKLNDYLYSVYNVDQVSFR